MLSVGRRGGGWGVGKTFFYDGVEQEEDEGKGIMKSFMFPQFSSLVQVFNFKCSRMSKKEVLTEKLRWEGTVN